MLYMTENGKIQGLVHAARNGDRAAFERLTGEYRPRLRKMIDFRLGGALSRTTDVEDVLQETELRSLQSICRFRYDGEESFFRWLTGIADKVILELARKERRRTAEPVGEDVPGTETSQSRVLARNERLDRLRQALVGLSEDHRQAIMLAIIGGLPLKDVAKKMNRSPNAMSQLLIRALRKLKDGFGDTASLHLPDLAILEREKRDDTESH